MGDGEGPAYPGDIDEVFERVSDAFYAVDEEFRFTYLNERAEELLQADADELLGKRLWDEYPEATETDAYRAFHEALETQQATEYELYYEPLDFWVNARVYPSEDGLSVYFRDVTERKQREQQLRRQRERLAALNNVHEVVRDINRALVAQSSREEIEQLVCDSLAASDSYQFAWVGTADERAGEVVPTTAANTQGYLEDVTITTDDGTTGQGPTGSAVRTGEPQFVRDVDDDSEFRPWREQAHERGFTATAAIPITYEGTQYGVLNVYTTRGDAFGEEEGEVMSQLGEIMGLAIATLEYEQELEHERERLEFVNRLVRHNLLNSLNVVDARIDIVGKYTDPEAKPHVETIQKRTEEMIDLVEKLRAMMSAFGASGERELEAVDLERVLRKELEQAAETFGEAVFEVRGDLDQAGHVMADDLLEEAVENLLSNAIQHNDADVPRVTLDVERGEETTTVRIADNGPGVPDELKETIFQKGEKAFESPGTGFGLYFVREIVESYGGSVTVADNVPGGTVFSITLPRA